MTDSPDITEVKECFRASDDAKLLDVFQRFIASDKWPTSCHKWGEENAEELSAFIQHIVPLLPVSTPVDVVGELCRNYMLGLAQVPQSIDITAKVFVDFWNRKRAEEDDDAVSFLSFMLTHPDGDYVAETARNAVGLADQLGIDKAKDTKSC